MTGRGFHWMIRERATSPAGRPVLLLRAGVGYWPCLRAVFVQLAAGRYMVDVWYGDPSYQKGLTG